MKRKNIPLKRQYTLSFTCEEVSFAYLHLIDNMTDNDVDLLADTSTGSATYTFEARTTDYESRFKLVFATDNNANDNAKNGGDAYSYYQGNRGSGMKLDAEDFPGLPGHGLETHQNAPLGSGIAVLTALGAAYLVGKRRKEE